MSQRKISTENLIEELEALLTGGSAELAAQRTARALCFDADGTLWREDVSEIVFHAAIQRSLLSEVALPALCELAERFGLSQCSQGDSSAAELAAQLFQAYLRGALPERETCEMMSFCYAGLRAEALRAFAEETLFGENPRVNYIQEVAPVLSWAKRRGVRCLLISASPQWIVEVASFSLGFAQADVHGLRVEINQGVLEPRITPPTTYAEGKAARGQEVLGAPRWLAAFGDSPFDFAMLQAAEIAVGVAPKQSLRELLPHHPNAFEL